jgi:demethylmenaquinone methyltransferase/2-methoxy-6-polyprenyl-1,4-benzoquinol methylase
MFASIAQRYDKANDVLSLGIHRLWRRKAVALAGIKESQSVLDLCCGTGDFAFASAAVVGTSGRVVGLDFVAEMLELANEKQDTTHRVESSATVRFMQGDAQRLPFEDGEFDAVTIGFGIRNVDDPSACLAEIRRVLKPSGVAVILEFGQPTLPIFAQCFQLYSKYLMPKIGALLTGNQEAYEYLPETSKSFPRAKAFLDLMEKQNFKNLEMKPLLSGLAYIYLGRR